MKIKLVLFSILLMCYAFAKAQTASKDYRKDSLQFKMYTRLYIDQQLNVDSVSLRKVFCDWCSESQMEILRQEAIRQSLIEQHNPRYKKPGEHRLALYVRFSKEDFKNLNTTDEQRRR